MAVELFGQVNVQFETNQNLTDDEVKALRKKFKQMVDEWDTQFLDLLDELNIESRSVYAVFEDSSYPLQITA